MEANAATPAPSSETNESMFDPPAPGFQRSPALLHQMRLLEENPQSDYVLVRPHPEPDHGVMFKDAMGRVFFLLCRRRAMSSGDEAAVKKMYGQMSDNAKSLPGVGLDGLRKQLLNEYGVDITKNDGGPTNPITDKEIEEILRKA